MQEINRADLRMHLTRKALTRYAAPLALGACVAADASNSMLTTLPAMNSSKPTLTLSYWQRLMTSPIRGFFFRRPYAIYQALIEVSGLVKLTRLDTSVCVVEVMQ